MIPTPTEVYAALGGLVSGGAIVYVVLWIRAGYSYKPKPPKVRQPDSFRNSTARNTE